MRIGKHALVKKDSELDILYKENDNLHFRLDKAISFLKTFSHEYLYAGSHGGPHLDGICKKCQADKILKEIER